MDKHRFVESVLLALAFLVVRSDPASAQSTDAYHAIQVFPVVVDTASFAQRFSFRNPYSTAITLKPRYFPANGTTATAQTCPNLVVAAQSTATVASLRALCPGLPANSSQFGYLHVQVEPATRWDIGAFSAFSRVANPQGNGFSVEAFPAHTFTSARLVVNGVRRLAATANAPAFQTNCFLGVINDINAGSLPTTKLRYTLLTSANATIASAEVDLLPGQIVRLLDVFAIAPAGDYNDASVRFENLGTDKHGVIAFCTVQDNTSFGADFRIAKQELGDSYTVDPIEAVGARDEHVRRDTYQGTDALGHVFYLPNGKFYNVHEAYFRHPDLVMCELVDVNTNAPLVLATSNLEIWMLPAGGGPSTPASIGNATGFISYIGDKLGTNGGANGRFLIYVEDGDTGMNLGNRPYRLHCKSGSGHLMGNAIKFNLAGDFR